MSKILSNLKVSGLVNIYLYEQNGVLKETRTVKNLVVNSGMAFILSRICASTKDPMSYIQLGSNSTAAAPSDTINTLSTSGITGTARIPVTFNLVGNSLVISGNYTTGSAAGTISELGIVNVSSGSTGDLLCRTTFDPIVKSTYDTLLINWTITLSV